ncbi:MAG: hypothetical protein K0S76_1966 [Herbinix sp.]|jgi:hypothetical protein|nr:hypothetical protein [Herbinix sp.]
METIKNYLDNMFAALPKTVQLADLKSNILSNMEDKYNELKAEGKSENEAIGIVISEFGNIDELISELGIRKEEDINTIPLVTQEETDEYLAIKRKAGFLVGIGVVLCILGAASLILVYQLGEDGFIGDNLPHGAKESLGLFPLFILVAMAVGLFIFSGMHLEKYAYMEKGVQLPISVKVMLQQQYNSFTPTYYLSLIIGITLCILSPTALFITSMMGNDESTYGVVILLFIVSIAVYLFIYFGTIRESYSKLLQIEEYKPKKMTKEDKVISAVASIVWPLAVAIFLFLGFVYAKWGIAWVVFPITGILFGMFASAYSIITGKNDN